MQLICSAAVPGGWLWVWGRMLASAGHHQLLPMKTQRISHLTAEQVHAVFSSDRFLDLTDSQLAALHHRSEQLQAQQRWTRARRRRRTLKAAAVVVALVALAPFWQVVLGVGAIALIWALLIAVLWDAVQRVRASIAGGPKAAVPGHQQ